MWQSPPDWQIDKGWLRPLLTAGRRSVFPRLHGTLGRSAGRPGSGKQLRKHLVPDLNLAVTVGGQAIRYTQCKTQPHAVLSPLLRACLSTIHMYESELRKRGVATSHKPQLVSFFECRLSQWIIMQSFSLRRALTPINQKFYWLNSFCSVPKKKKTMAAE